MFNQLSSKFKNSEELDTPLLNPQYPKGGASLVQDENTKIQYLAETLNDLEIFVAEFLGTALLLFFGCLGQFANASQFEILAPMQGGIVFGFVVASVIASIGHISEAHLNPAVTLCSYILKRISLRTTIVYLLAELFGSVLGFWLLKEVIPQKLFNIYANNSCGFCTTSLHSTISPQQGFLIEFLATSFLVLLVCSAWDPRNLNKTDSTPIKFGLFIAAAAITTGPFTGCSMNPTRSFAPAVINNQWTNHWIYWLAPLSGSTCTTLFYKYFFIRKNSAVKNYPSHQFVRFS